MRKQGITTERGSYFQGENYRIDWEGDKLTISRLYSQEIIYQVNDLRKTEGVIEIQEFRMTEQDQESLSDYANSFSQDRKREENLGIYLQP